MKKHSTLFLDRDGVINTELPADYVKTWEEFHFEEGVFEALQILQAHFDRLIIVTNQRGVGAGIMTQKDLDTIHQKMIEVLSEQGITIHGIYAAIDEDRASLKRKPHPYLGYEAKNDFPEIDFQNSYMIGNSGSDMEFGKTLGMYNVFIDDKKKFNSADEVPNADTEADSLLEFAMKF